MQVHILMCFDGALLLAAMVALVGCLGVEPSAF